MELYTLREAGDILHLDQRRMYALSRQGVVPSVKIGGRFMVPADALAKWQRQQVRAALARCKGGDAYLASQAAGLPWKVA